MSNPKKEPEYNLPCNRCKKSDSSPFKDYPCLECRRNVLFFFVCPRCKRPHASKYMGVNCMFCFNDPIYIKELEKLEKSENKRGKNAGLTVRRYNREPVAFGVDKQTGREYAIDGKGKKFDPDSTRYNLKTDPNGWKATDAK